MQRIFGANLTILQLNLGFILETHKFLEFMIGIYD